MHCIDRGKRRLRILFDNEQEKEDVINCICPSDIGLKDKTRCCMPMECQECWEEAVEMEVKE